MDTLPLSQLHLPPGVRVRARLLRSIREKGVLVPILVKRNGTGYDILDGRRRATAALQAGLSEIPATIVEGGGPEITLLAHATRSENPVAELEAIRELERRGMSEKEIARAGFSSLPRIRRLAKLNHLAPELAEKASSGEIAPGVAFQIAGLSHEEQHLLLADNQPLTSRAVRQAKQVCRQAEVPTLIGLVEEHVTFDDVLASLSAGTLAQVLAELPEEPHFRVWRSKISRLLKEPVI